MNGRHHGLCVNCGIDPDFFALGIGVLFYPLRLPQKKFHYLGLFLHEKDSFERLFRSPYTLKSSCAHSCFSCTDPGLRPKGQGCPCTVRLCSCLAPVSLQGRGFAFVSLPIPSVAWGYDLPAQVATDADSSRAYSHTRSFLVGTGSPHPPRP